MWQRGGAQHKYPGSHDVYGVGVSQGRRVQVGCNHPRTRIADQGSSTVSTSLSRRGKRHSVPGLHRQLRRAQGVIGWHRLVPRRFFVDNHAGERRRSRKEQRRHSQHGSVMASFPACLSFWGSVGVKFRADDTAYIGGYVYASRVGTHQLPLQSGLSCLSTY